MFGMLDYRAHKLLRLICFPVNVVIWFSFLVVIPVVSVLIVEAKFSSNDVLVKIVIAYVIAELIALVVNVIIFNGLIRGFIQRAFFWVIDVVPAHGVDAEEARAIVLQGRAFELNKKLET